MSVFVQHADRAPAVPRSRLTHWGRGLLWTIVVIAFIPFAIGIMVWQRYWERRDAQSWRDTRT